MKKYFILTTLCLISLQAKEIVLTSEQEKNWEIVSKMPQITQRLPLGEFVTEVVTPPSLLHTISLPFEANVKKLHVAKYQEVKKGTVLAEVTGTQWISIQQKAISNAIEYKHHSQLTARKNKLCKEEIIPQKVCVAANAELKADTIRVAASKALLKSYGANDEMIDTLYRDLKLSPTIKVTSNVDGRVVKLGATPGKSTSPSDALFVIQAKGALWLESHIEASRTESLYEGQNVQITLGHSTFDTHILQLSPVINPVNQTRLVRFLVPKDINIFSGLRKSATITLKATSLKIKKTSVIKEGKKHIVFVKTAKGYHAVPIDILSEKDTYYFVNPSNALKKHEIATTSVAILKNMLGESDE